MVLVAPRLRTNLHAAIADRVTAGGVCQLALPPEYLLFALAFRSPASAAARSNICRVSTGLDAAVHLLLAVFWRGHAHPPNPGAGAAQCGRFNF